MVGALMSAFVEKFRYLRIYINNLNKYAETELHAGKTLHSKRFDKAENYTATLCSVRSDK